jgi:glycosyltransferase involved in cell wall biosynthesis
MATIWIDVEDLFDYAVVNPRPSGIQRVEYEICRSLMEASGASGRIRFLRHAQGDTAFRSIPWEEVKTLYSVLTAPRFDGLDTTLATPRPEAPALRKAAPGMPRRVLRWLAQRFPQPVREPLIGAVVQQIGALRSLGRAGKAAMRGLSGGSSGPARPQAEARPASLIEAQAVSPSEAGAVSPDADIFNTAPGDILLVLGSPWFHKSYASLIARLKAEKGLRFGLLIYDIIPLRRPEWCDQTLVQLFAGWMGSVLPHADTVMAISRASADDLAHYAAEQGLKLGAPPVAIPMGTGFGKPAPATHRPDRELPAPGSYALIVSTIEARKNHILLFRVWRRLLEELPHDQVPTLVFAGRVGWMVADLMQQFRNASYLDGKLVLVEDPTDGELTSLYEGCLFTMFPSFYEGWGLPVSESLSFGRPCIVSNATSLPEAGGALARYFDPENTVEAHAVIRDVIRDREGLRAWQARVAREFRPVSWDTSAKAVLRALGEDSMVTSG